MSAAKLMATELAPEVAAMLVKKLGKSYTRKITMKALPMDMPFSLNGVDGEPGDYLLMADDGEMSVCAVAVFKQMFGMARRGRKRHIPATLPPSAAPAPPSEGPQPERSSDSDNSSDPARS